MDKDLWEYKFWLWYQNEPGVKEQFDIKECHLGSLCMQKKKWCVIWSGRSGRDKHEYLDTLVDVRNFINDTLVDWEWIKKEE